MGTSTLRELGWLTILDRVRYFAILHVFKIRKRMAPSYLCRSFAPVSSVHSHHTRGSIYDYHISREDIPGCFSYFGKNQWNNLPVELKSIDSIVIFKVRLKRYLLAEY